MLGRAGGGSAIGLAQLLQAVFFEAQSEGARVITARHLRAAAQKVANGGPLMEALKELALTERMPLLSLLQTRPLELQSTHLSIQEFYAARAICEGAVLSTPLWQLPAYWANTVRLGLDMGDAFGRALVRSAGKAFEGSTVKVEQLGGDRRTSATAVAAALCSSNNVTQLDLYGTLGDGDMDAIGAVLLKHSTGKLSLLRCDTFGVSEGDATCDLRGKGLGPGAASLLAAVVNGNAVLKELFLGSNAIGDQGATALGGALRVNAVLTTLSLHNNNVGKVGCSALADALRVNAVLKASRAQVPVSLACAGRQAAWIDARGASLARPAMMPRRPALARGAGVGLAVGV